MFAKVIFSGSGGQGIQLASKVFCQACVEENLNISLIPSYGAEMRGGNTTCRMVVSDTIIASPLFNEATHILVLTDLAYQSFKTSLVEKGILVYDEKLSAEKPAYKIQMVKIRAIHLADKEINNLQLLNSVALGAFIKTTKLISLDSAEKAIKKIIGAKKKDLFEANMEALKLGFQKGIA